MSFLRQIIIDNGGYDMNFNYYTCDTCGRELPESWPRADQPDGTDYCYDCGFKQGLVSEREYISCSGVVLNNTHVAVNPDGEVCLWVGPAIPPWLRPLRQQRNSPQIAAWRIAVFERDNYTCADCEVRGGRLNAHHIKSFKDYPKLRHDVDNGITLCECCHRKRHKGGEANRHVYTDKPKDNK